MQQRYLAQIRHFQRQLSNRAGQRRGGVLSAAERRGALFEALTKTVRSDAARGEVLTLMYEAAAGNDEEAAPMQWPTKEGSHAAEARKAAGKDKAKRGGKGEAEEVMFPRLSGAFFHALEAASSARFHPPAATTAEDAAPASSGGDDATTPVRRGTLAQVAAGKADAIASRQAPRDAKAEGPEPPRSTAEAPVVVERVVMPPDIATLIGGPLPPALDEPEDPLEAYRKETAELEALEALEWANDKFLQEHIKSKAGEEAGEAADQLQQQEELPPAEELQSPRAAMRSPTPSTSELQGDPAVGGCLKRWWKFVGDDRNGFISKRRHVDITRAICWLLGTRRGGEPEPAPEPPTPRRSSHVAPEPPPRFDPAVVARVCMDEWARLFGAETEAIKFDVFYDYTFTLVTACRPGLHSEDFVEWLEEMLQRLENLDLALLELPYNNLVERQRLERRWELRGEDDPFETAEGLRKERDARLSSKRAERMALRREAEERQRLAMEMERKEREEREERERLAREKAEREERLRREQEEREAAIRRKEEELRAKREAEAKARAAEERKRRAEEERIRREQEERERRRQELLQKLAYEEPERVPLKIDMHLGLRILKRLRKRIPADNEILGLDLQGLPGLYALTYEERTAIRRFRAADKALKEGRSSPWVPPHLLKAPFYPGDLGIIQADMATQTFVLPAPTERDEEHRKMDGYVEWETDFVGAHHVGCQASLPNDHVISVGDARGSPQKLPPLALMSGRTMSEQVRTLPRIGEGRLAALQQCILDGTLPPAFTMEVGRMRTGPEQLARAVNHQFGHLLRTTGSAPTIERGLQEMKRSLHPMVREAAIPNAMLASCEVKQNDRARSAVQKLYGRNAARSMARVAWAGRSVTGDHDDALDVTLPSERFSARIKERYMQRMRMGRVDTRVPGVRAAFGTQDSIRLPNSDDFHYGKVMEYEKMVTTIFTPRGA